MTGIIELVTRLGEGNISCQFMDHAMTAWKAGKRENRITFVTDQGLAEVRSTTMPPLKECGLVLWMPRDKVSAVMNDAPDPDGKFGRLHILKAALDSCMEHGDDVAKSVAFTSLLEWVNEDLE